MELRRFAVFLVLITLPLARASETVLTLTGIQALENEIKKHGILATEFYAPWCGHCQQLEPQWTKAAELLAMQEQTKRGVALAKVDATLSENAQATAKYAIKGFPTILIFRAGNMENPKTYSGPRNAVAIVEYIKKLSAPAALLLESREAVSSFQRDSGDASAIAFVPSKDSKEFVAFLRAADAVRDDIAAAYVLKREFLGDCSGVDCDSPVVFMYKADSSAQPRYNGNFSELLLTQWLQSHASPLVAMYSQNHTEFQRFTKSWRVPLPKIFFFADKEKELLDHEVLSSMSAAAEANDGLKFFLASVEGGEKLLEFLGIPLDTPAPFFVANAPKTGKKYLKSSVKIQDLPEFVREFQEGALDPFVKTEFQGGPGPSVVVPVTAKTYGDLILNSGKHTFIEFYAPWCGHCKKLAPAWEAVGDALKSTQDVVVAKMDAASHADIPDDRVAISGFPSMYFLGKGAEGRAVKYHGPRDVQSLVGFVREQLEYEEIIWEEHPTLGLASEREEL